MNKHTLIPATVIAAAFAFGGVAHAHNAAASATCQGGVSYSATSYENVANTVTVRWDGVTATGFPKTFGTSSSGTVANPDKTKPHSWRVAVDQGNGSQFDFTYQGEVAACVVVAPTTTTTTTLPPTTTVAPTTTVGTSSVPVSTVTASDDETTPVVLPTAVVAVAVADPPVPAQGVLSSGQLPATGADDGLLLAVAALMVAAGGLTLRVARRRGA